MKPFLLLLLSVSIFYPPFAGKIYAGSKSQQEIQIKEATIPAKPVRGRASCPVSIKAWIDDLNYIEVQHNGSPGNITITNRSEHPAFNQYADTGTMPHTMIPFSAAGRYHLTICGGDYFAEAALHIQ